MTEDIGLTAGKPFLDAMIQHHAMCYDKLCWLQDMISDGDKDANQEWVHASISEVLRMTPAEVIEYSVLILRAKNIMFRRQQEGDDIAKDWLRAMNGLEDRIYERVNHEQG